MVFAKSVLPLGTKNILQVKVLADLLHKYIVVTATLLLAVKMGNAVAEYFIGELVIAILYFS
jgi:hypothetical protein